MIGGLLCDKKAWLEVCCETKGHVKFHSEVKGCMKVCSESKGRVKFHSEIEGCV
jgi:hypothetical protein